MSLITDNDAVAAFCARQKGAQFVAIDTEFMRERTYWPILCVVQVAGPEEAVASMRWPRHRPEAAVGADVGRADPQGVPRARQDLEIFFQLSASAHPVFDTQWRMVCALRFRQLRDAGQRLAGASLDKASRYRLAHRR